jgi:hypothetical protein
VDILDGVLLWLPETLTLFQKVAVGYLNNIVLQRAYLEQLELSSPTTSRVSGLSSTQPQFED